MTDVTDGITWRNALTVPEEAEEPTRPGTRGAVNPSRSGDKRLALAGPLGLSGLSIPSRGKSKKDPSNIEDSECNISEIVDDYNDCNLDTIVKLSLAEID